MAAKVDGEKRKATTRVLIDQKTNKILAEETSLEGMSVKIDMIRAAKYMIWIEKTSKALWTANCPVAESSDQKKYSTSARPFYVSIDNGWRWPIC